MMLTSPENVRLKLGLTATEMPDETILSSSVADFFKLQLYELGVYTLVTTTIAKDPRSEEEEALVLAVKLFETLAICKYLGSSLGLSVPKEYSDGKDTEIRFTDALKTLLEKIELEYVMARQQVKDFSYNVDSIVKVPPTTLVVVQPTYDPNTIP